MQNIRTNATVAPGAEHGEVIGVGYFRIPAPKIEQRFDLRRRNAEIADTDHFAMLCTGRHRGVCADILHCSSPLIFTRSRSFSALLCFDIKALRSEERRVG